MNVDMDKVKKQVVNKPTLVQSVIKPSQLQYSPDEHEGGFSPNTSFLDPRSLNFNNESKNVEGENSMTDRSYLSTQEYRSTANEQPSGVYIEIEQRRVQN